MKKILGIMVLSLLLNSCASGPRKVDGNSAQVYIEDNWQTLSNPEAANIAQIHCSKYNKNAQYYKYLINGYDVHWLFKCVAP